MRKAFIIIAFILGRWPRPVEKGKKIVTFNLYFNEERGNYTLGVKTPDTGKTELVAEFLSDTALFDLLRKQAVANVANFHSKKWY